LGYIIVLQRTMMIKTVKIHLLIAITFGIISGSCAHFIGISPNDRLRRDISEVVENPDFYSANIGIYIESLKTGEIIFEQNHYKFFMPASNVKLFTTTTALVRLGPDYTYKTTLYSRGEVTAGGDSLNGDLLLKGSGDPTISGRFTNGDNIKTFKDWADSLKQCGITQITGNIFVDDSCFDSGGISFNDNSLQIIINPAAESGKPAVIRLNPPTTYFNIINKTTTVSSTRSRQVRSARKPETNDIVVEGNIAINRSAVTNTLAVDDPALFAAGVFKDVLVTAGIQVTGVPRKIESDSTQYSNKNNWIKRAVYTSPPLSAILKATNKPSDNFYADQLLKTIGFELKGFGTFENGAQVVKEFVNEIGINGEQLFLVDGSGLSRYNLAMPIQIAKLLKYMRYHPYFNYFYDSLPIAGVDGTISNRMKNTPAENIVHAKTGTLRYVRSLSGYVKSKDDEEFIVSILINHYTTPESTSADIQDKIMILLANFSRGK